MKTEGRKKYRCKGITGINSQFLHISPMAQPLVVSDIPFESNEHKVWNGIYLMFVAYVCSFQMVYYLLPQVEPLVRYAKIKK